MKYLNRYTQEQARRHDVKPGITGWALVNGRNAMSCEEKFRLNVWYVDNWSLALDLRIIWMTVLKVVRREGISADGEATMPEFMGSRKDAKTQALYWKMKSWGKYWNKKRMKEMISLGARIAVGKPILIGVWGDAAGGISAKDDATMSEFMGCEG
jgi:hypothetical protein